MTADKNRTERIEDFAIIANEIDVSLDDLIEITSNLCTENAADLIASIAGLIQEKVAALTLIFEELTNDSR